MSRSLLLIVSFFTLELSAQIGGFQGYEFLNLSPSARSTAMGGYMSAIRDADINLLQANPALLSSQTHHQVAINHSFHFADISYGSVAYGFGLDSVGLQIGLGVQYIDYGSFTRRDERDLDLGDFSGGEQAIHLSVARQWEDRIALGATLKWIHSNLDIYQRHAIAMDIGANYINPEKRSSVSFVIKNIGTELSSGGLQHSSLPLDVQLSYAKRLEHLPFRWTLTAHHLHIGDLQNNSEENNDPIFINQTPSEPSRFSDFIDNTFRHLSFGGELLLGANEAVAIRLGYNHLRNRQLSTSAFRSFSGFSFGFGIKVKKIRIDYALANYHLTGGVNHLSLLVDLDELMSRF